MRYVLGIDTSNYTTSLCAISAADGQMAAEVRRLLPVAKGQRGLRQSEALFFHVRRLPALMDDLMGQLRRQDAQAEIVAIGVSFRPRPLAASYMPAFLAGASFAAGLGRVLGVPVLQTSHQEGHIAAATHGASQVPSTFLAVHLSGGTSDVLLARETRLGYQITMLGEGADLHAGQFVDRVGVQLGLPFPAGSHLESLARQAASDFRLRFPASVRGASISFSGPCSAALRAVGQGQDKAEIAAAVQACIASSLVKAIQHAQTLYPAVEDCVIAGGVAENLWIRERIRHRLAVQSQSMTVHFAPSRFSSDQALGVAVIAWRHWCEVPHCVIMRRVKREQGN